MPLYEYRCQDCGHRFEVLQRMGEGADGLVCPKCARGELEKQFSTFASAGGEGGGDLASRVASCGGGSGFS